MSCFSVYIKTTNRQIRVFHHEYTDKNDRQRAQKLAVEFADKQHGAGYPCVVEQFHISDSVGVEIHDTERK